MDYTPRPNQTQINNAENQDVAESINSLEKLNSTSKVTIKEEFISLNKQYNVYVDGDKIGTISGKYVNLTGDVFTFKDTKGNIISSEKQIKRWGVKLNRMAELRDKNGNAVGYIGENVIKDLFSVSKYKFHFYDKDKNEYAHTKEKILSLLYDFQVYDNKDDKIYEVKENFNMLVSEYTITKVKDSNLTMDRIVYLTCIVDAIREAEEKSE